MLSPWLSTDSQKSFLNSPTSCRCSFIPFALIVYGYLVFFFVHCQFFFICHTLPSCKRTLLLAGTWLRVLVSPVLPHLRVLRCAQLFENSSPRRYAAAVAIERKRIIFEEDAKKQDFRRVLELNSD